MGQTAEVMAKRIADQWYYRLLAASMLVVLITGLLYYPKWNKPHTEATLSWDVSGYYFYLPALFIYQDITKLAWKDSIQEKYSPASSLYQAFPHRSGNYIMKYSAGMAVMYLPFFIIGHAVALVGPWPADGFSLPYQLAINLGCLLVALAGLWFLGKVLKAYFSPLVAGITVLSLTLATNYLNYSAIDGAMTHNYLFTLYALLLWSTWRLYLHPRWPYAIMIGAIIGLAALTRPTELIIILIPLLWGVSSVAQLRERLNWLFKNKVLIVLTIITAGMIGFIQLAYWRLAGYEWLIYSYQDQGFSWLKAHIYQGLFSFKKGWLVYTPYMILAVAGLAPLFRQQRGLFWVTTIFILLFIYITFAWDIWWYGGSLGQRAMVQSYALLAFPLAALVTWVLKRTWSRALWLTFGLFCAYYNLWLTHQAHKGGLLDPENMTKAYFWKIFLRHDTPPDVRKLLDTNEWFAGDRKNIRTLGQLDFERDSLPGITVVEPLQGQQSFLLNAANPFTPELSVPLSPGDVHWLRAEAWLRTPQKEGDVWRMPQLVVRFFDGEKIIKEKFIRSHRFLHDHQARQLYMDVQVPERTFDRVSVFFWNVNSEKETWVDDLRLEGFDVQY